MFDPYILLALVIVITIHECAHALVSNALGDPTAKLAGRISLNPLAHLDPLGVLMLLVIHIGWGKPVPVNDRYFTNPKRDTTLTALAGPFSNLILALVLAIPLKYFSGWLHPVLEHFLKTVFDISIVLFAFNMIPFPPLDGSKIIGIFIPDQFQLAYQRYLRSGMLYFFIFLLFDQFVLGKLFGMSILQMFIGNIYTIFNAAIFLGT